MALSPEVPDSAAPLYHWRDLAEANGEPSWTLPIPGTYVIDTGGTIRYASAHPNYMTRPEPEDALAALESLA